MKKSGRQLVPEHYKDLDAPIYIWNKIHQTSDLSWLLVKRKKLTKKAGEFLVKVWEGIYDEFIREFGVSEDYANVLEKKKEIILLRCKLAEENDRTQLTWIEIAEEELKNLEKSIGKSDFMKSKMAIEKQMGIYLPLKEVSIREFYSYMKNLK